jgi:PAS domain S-box-containing protein
MRRGRTSQGAPPVPDVETFRAFAHADRTPTLLLRADGVVIAANPAADTLLRPRPGEPLRAEVRAALEAFLADCFGARDARSADLVLPTPSGDLLHVRCDGAALGSDALILRLQHSPDGTGGGATIDDLQEQIRRREASEARLRAVIETAVDGVILSDAYGTVLVFNPACEKLFGYRAEEVVGQNVRMLMPPPFRDEHDGYLDHYRSTGEKRIIGIGREVVGQRKDGTTFPMDLSVGEARHGGERIFVGIIHDLTYRKRMEEQLIQAQKMEAVGQLSGGIAHDFNNLLTVIIGSAETLSDRLKARPDLRHHTGLIQRAGERGAELTARLLAFSRRQMLRPADIDCNALLRSMKTLLRRTLREDIELGIELDADLWTAVADPGQLESAVLNLALNAQDAMPHGGHLTIATANTPFDERYTDAHLEVKSGPYVMIAITDDGQGMPPEVLERVFEPFYTTKEVGKGSGLGLSMVYGFVKQSNGHVTIYSEPGLGTTVRLYLPALETRANTAAAADSEPASECAGTVPKGDATVLVVEDDSFVRAFAISSLESLGYRVLAAVDGPEALGLIQGDVPVDLLFTDVVMPGGMSGWELAARARRLRPGLKVLLTSGYAVETLASRGRGHPEMLLLNKPYRKSDLARRVHEALAAPPQP